MLVIGPGDLSQAAVVLTALEAGTGRDDEMRAALLQFARAGGGGPFSDQAMLDWSWKYGGFHGNEPWRWLAAVAEGAVRASDLLLAARASLFLVYFCSQLTPLLVMGDELEYGLSKSPPIAARATITSVMLTACESLDSDLVVAQNRTGTVRVGEVRVLCAEHLIALSMSGTEVDESALATARSVAPR